MGIRIVRSLSYEPNRSELCDGGIPGMRYVAWALPYCLPTPGAGSQPGCARAMGTFGSKFGQTGTTLQPRVFEASVRRTPSVIF